MAHLPTRAACAARLVNRTFRDCVDQAQPDLFADKLAAHYQRRTRGLTDAFAKKTLARATTLSWTAWREPPHGRADKHTRSLRRAEVARIWDMVGWAKQLQSLSLTHHDVLDERFSGVMGLRFPALLTQLHLDAQRLQPLLADVWHALEDGALRHLTTLSLHNLDLRRTGPARREVAPLQLPLLTRLQLVDCVVDARLGQTLQTSTFAPLRHLTMALAAAENPDANVAGQLLDVAVRGATSLRELCFSLTPPPAPQAVVTSLTTRRWPHLRRLVLPALPLPAPALTPFASDAFAALQALILPATAASAAAYCALRPPDGRSWHALCLQEPLVVGELSDVAWLANPAFARLRELKVTLRDMDVHGAQALIWRIGPHVAQLDVSALQLVGEDAQRLVAGLTTVVLPNVRELIVSPTLLEDGDVVERLAGAPFAVYVEAWEGSTYCGYYL